MHYKNGREAKNGDRVVLVTSGQLASGILHGATPGNDHCNGMVRQVNGQDWSVNLQECIHADDVLAGLATIADSTKSVPATS